MSRYGDTPAGMVESAMEFLRICKDENFDNVVVSMKASNTKVMVSAYRLLVAAMDAEDMQYPLHLGVTEAGDGEDGRIKSAVGIGSLLADGYGDTIRVSLTEAPANEIPVAQELVNYFVGDNYGVAECVGFDFPNIKSNRASLLGNEIVVISDLSKLNQITASDIESLGLKADCPQQGPIPDYVYVGSAKLNDGSDNSKIIDSNNNKFVFCDYLKFDDSFLAWLRENQNKVLVVSFDGADNVAEQRSVFLKLHKNGIVNPIIIARSYSEQDFEKLQIMAACDFGALLIDGFGDGIMLSAAPNFSPKLISDFCFRVLQAARARYTRTEYIACPGCGRTLFDLQDTLKKVKAATSQFNNLKIGIMGCIVNGPGEMADAEYGYVGAGHGKITLYKGKEAVKKNIPQENAINELIELIKQK
jgi:(E)-4-hydroxy-3-methylbut-2-enyl-diphosphate synthase